MKPPADPVSCLKCDALSPCVNWTDVDIGVGIQTFEHQFECPAHGRFAFVYDEKTRTSRAVFQED